MLKRSSPTPCLASRCSRRTLFSSLSPGSRRGFAGTVLKRIQNRNFQHFVFSKLLEYETDWYDMMEILLSRLEDEPVDQDKFQASRFFGFISFCLIVCLLFLFITGDCIEGLGKLGADPARRRHAEAEDQGGDGGEALPEADPCQHHRCQACQPHHQAAGQHEGHQADLQ